MTRRRAGIHAAAPAVGALPRDPVPADRRLCHRRASSPGGLLRARFERGQTVEAVIIYPVILGLIFLMIQVGIWAYARNIALSGAHEGALAAAAYQSGASASGTAQSVIGDAGSGLFHDVSVTENRTAEAVTVSVSGRAMSLIPLVELPAIEQSSTVPIERYVPAENGAVTGGKPPAMQ